MGIYGLITRRPQHIKTTLLALVLVVATAFSVAVASESEGSRQQPAKFISVQQLGASKAEKTPKFVEGELLVKFREGVTDSKKEGLHRGKGAKKIRDFKPIRVHRLKLKEGVSVEEAMKSYKADPDVEYAEPNFIVSADSVPNDPDFGNLWGLSNATYPGADINAPAAWDISTGSDSVVVAIIDSGIDYTHEDLAANIWVNPGEIPGNGIDDDGNGYVDDVHGINAITGIGNPMDDRGHGTHVAGTIGAVGDNALGVAGVNWSVKMIGCKFLNPSGSGSIADSIECLLYLKGLRERTQNRVNIVAANNSWGSEEYSQALFDAINAQQELLFVASAGNNNYDNDRVAHYPASFNLPNVISVANTDQKDNISATSNYGSRSVHLGAPGQGILSTISVVNTFGASGRYYSLSGTSMATPHVTGLAALINAQDPGRNWIATKNLLLSGGDDLESMYGRTITGKRIDVYGSLTCTNRPLFSILNPPLSISVGSPATLSVLSINCEAPSGPVTVTLSGVEIITLNDDGVFPDLAAEDGIFTATWTPSQSEDFLTFSSPAGSGAIEFPSLEISTAFLPNAQLNTPYAQTLSPSAGYPPFSWSVVRGALPPGIVLNGATGELAGIPTEIGTSFYDFTLQVVDAYGAKAVQDFSVDIYPAGIYAAWDRLEDSKYWPRGYNYDYLPGNLRHVAVDQSGNIYVTQTTVNINFDISLIKYNSSGKELWSRVLDNKVSDESNAIAVDKDGFIYVGGSSYVQSIATDGEYVLVKLDPDGNVVWTKTYTGYPLNDVTTDDYGYIYVTGKKGGDQVVLKLDSSGTIVFEKVVDNPENIYRLNIKIDNNGNICLGGFIYHSGNNNNLVDIVVLKYDSSGNMIWYKIYDQYGINETAQDVAVDTIGNIYVTGWSYTYGMYNSNRLLVHKYDPSGNLLWRSSYGYGSENRGYSLALDKNNNVIVTGSIYNFDSNYDSDFLTLKYDPSGNLIWGKILNQGANEYGDHVAVDEDGNIVVVGSAGYLGRYAQIIKYVDPGLFFITNSTLPNGVSGKAYSATLLSKDGLLPCSWSVVFGSLPPGITLDSSTGVLSGIPTVIGAFPFTLQVTDATFKTSTKSLLITIYSDNDLSIAGLSGILNGNMLTFTVDVKNNGTTDQIPTVALYFSQDTSPATNDYVINHISAGNIASGSEKTLTGTMPIPLTVPGGFKYLTAIVDPDNVVIEPNETNNGVLGNQILINPSPDLMITSISGSVAGGNFSYSTTVRNGSSVSAEASTTTLYLSIDAVPSTTDYRVTQVSTAALAEGANKTYTGMVALPATIPVGTYYVVAIADTGNTVAETDESNNGAVGNQLLISPNPDLIITDISGTVAGGNFSYSATVRNSGSVPTAASYTTIYLSTDAVATTTDYLVTKVATVALAAVSEKVLTGSIALPATIPPGTYYVVAIADTGNTVMEADETNNGAVGNQQTMTHDLAINAVSGTVANGSLTYSVKVKNNGNASPSPAVRLYLSVDATAATSDYLISTLAAGAVAGSTEKTITGTVAVPATIPPGTYYVAAIADPINAVVETDETNNGAIGNQQSISRDLSLPAVSGTITGGMLSYSVTARNSGNVATAASTTTLYLSVDALAATTDYKVTTVATAALAAAANKIYTGSIALPSTIPPGTYYVVAIADTGNTVTESDETNNGAVGNTIVR